MTLKIIIIFSLLHLCYGRHLDAQEGNHQTGVTANLSIIRGYDVPVDKHPFMVRVISTNGTGFYTCGGTLVHPQFVLTAAHCLEGYNISVWNVYLGAHRYNNETAETISGLAFAQHDQYESEYSSHDIAIVKLQKPATLVPGLVETIPMAPAAPYLSAENAYDKRLGLVLGWGMIDDDPMTYPQVLQGLTVMLEAATQCFRSKFSVGTQCASRLSGKQGVVCGGDSGGPLVSGGVLVGVVASKSGVASCRISSYMFAARVDYHREWIDNKMKTM